MQYRKDGNCKHCNINLENMLIEETTTQRGDSFCSYECLEEFYDGEIPEDEDFIFVLFSRRWRDI